MSKISDPEYLRNDQYRDAGKLNARIRLHTGFSTNDYGWFRWVFDHYDVPKNARVLEVGCGPGYLWGENESRIPAGWEINISDFSPGMVAQAQKNLGGLSHPISFIIVDAHAIPMPDDSCEIIIANHCLYHLPDRSRALYEIRRVLKPDGWFYATTIGNNHLKEMSELVTSFEPAAQDVFNNNQNPFTLESGGSQLQEWFSEVLCSRYPDGLQVTEAAPLVDYVFSTVRLGLDEGQRGAFKAYLQEQMAARGGVFPITKESGIFVARTT